jgi:hypothetical protein
MLPELKIASPCSASWEQMNGDNRTRHCSQCNLNVYNFSEMTSAEIEGLIAASSGQRLCGRFYQRPDGTILTQDCPVGLRAKIRRVSRRLTTALAAAMSLVFTAQMFSQQPTPQQSAPQQPAPLQEELLMGDVAIADRTSFGLLLIGPSRAPLPNARVSLLDRTSHKTIAAGATDKAGKFNWSPIAAGDYTVFVWTTDHRNGSSQLSIKPGEVKEVTIKLEPHIVTMGAVAISQRK